MSIKLHLNEGDKVRNIRANSSRKGLVGFVERIQRDAKRGDKYLVKWSTGAYGTYFVELAHHSIEAVVDPKAARQTQKALTFFERYGAPLSAFVASMPWDMEKAEAMLKEFEAAHGGSIMVVHDEVQFTPKRRVLKKVRRNVVSGKTQDDYVRDCGYARGVAQFNTRALGLSTGQAMARIADALMHPGKSVRVWDVDHAITDPQVKAGRHQLNKTFVALVESLIEKNKLVGITFDAPKQYMTFNPIVTEETYVETH